MATYVTLYSFTDQGIRDIKDTVKRGVSQSLLNFEPGAAARRAPYS